MWSSHFEAWSHYMRAGGLPETTVGSRTYHLGRVAQAVDWVRTRGNRPETHVPVRFYRERHLTISAVTV